jgi:hypothetical protein
MGSTKLFFFHYSNQDRSDDPPVIENIMTQGHFLMQDHAAAWTSLDVVFKVLPFHNSPDPTSEKNIIMTKRMLKNMLPIMNDDRPTASFLKSNSFSKL